MDERLTIAEAAAHLDRSRSTIERWMRAKKIPVHRYPSGRPFFLPAELDACLTTTAAHGEDHAAS